MQDAVVLPAAELLHTAGISARLGFQHGLDFSTAWISAFREQQLNFCPFSLTASTVPTQ